MKNDPQKLRTYFLNEKKVLIIITITGIIYNVGMVAGPWFEGQLVQYLADIIHGIRQSRDIVILACIYVAVIAFVQFARYLKRFYVRRFANNVNRSLKTRIYHHAVNTPVSDAEEENVGTVMTKAVSDAEACAEGMRKSVTEVFDTGLVMIVYVVMLMHYDWKLTLLCLLFPPVAYIIAASLRKVIAKASELQKQSAAALHEETLDITSHALTYRVYGSEERRRNMYEDALQDYENKSVHAEIWDSTMEPVYYMIAMAGLVPILYFGGKNVMHTGWKIWNIAAFSTYIACFTKLAVKTSHAAKLFNAVQKAEVSWKRIKPYLKEEKTDTVHTDTVSEINVSHLSFHYPDSHTDILHDISFSAHKGEITGITGVIASGKTTLGKVFLNEYPYEGSVQFIDSEGIKKELRNLNEDPGEVSWVGHQPELSDMSIADNIRLTDAGDPYEDEKLLQVIKDVQFDKEAEEMKDGLNTVIGEGGIQLSGGQKQRIALARALYHHASVYILDDPFSAVDLSVERKIYESLREHESDSVILLLSHRLNLFPELDQVLWMENGTVTVSNHEELMKHNKVYADLYHKQVQKGNSSYE